MRVGTVWQEERWRDRAWVGNLQVHDASAKGVIVRLYACSFAFSFLMETKKN